MVGVKMSIRSTSNKGVPLLVKVNQTLGKLLHFKYYYRTLSGDYVFKKSCENFDGIKFSLLGTNKWLMDHGGVNYPKISAAVSGLPK